MNDLAIPPNQEIMVFQPDGKTSWKRELQRRREEEAWERIEREGVERLAFWREMSNDVSAQEVTILLTFPNELREFFMRLPRGSEWGFVMSFANKRLGEWKWIASMLGERWFNHERSPKHGHIVRPHWIDEKPTIYQNTMKIEETHVDPDVDEPSDSPPCDWTGDLKAPLEKIQIGTQRPLANGEKSSAAPGRIIVEPGVPSLELFKPELETPLTFDCLVPCDLKAVR
jgi:hypothetical protein